MEEELMRKILRQAGREVSEVLGCKCRHPPKQTAEQALEMFCTMENPSTKLLMEGMSDVSLEKTKGPFLEAHKDIWGSRGQFEVAVLAVGRKGGGRGGEGWG
jgi:hypothetical protein